MTLDSEVAEPTAPAEPPVDGRTARGQRTRSSVVDALLALQEEGTLAPTAQQVAARAGVALRTVFGHFSDMETLWAEAGQREMDKLADLRVVVDAELPLAERIELFCSSRSRVLEALMPVMRAARLREPTSPQLLRNREMFIAAGDQEVREVFAAELSALDPTARARRLDALYLALAGPAWEALRHDRGLSPAEATTVVQSTVTALLTC
jgi:TetR/AcrR family transcriptional regulator of autoinduction and epiphytic fitness